MEKPYTDDIDSTNIPPSRWRKFKTQCKENWFYITLISVALAGFLCAFILPPLILKSADGGDSIDSIRKAILAVFAGALTMLTLWETHRKNTQEKNKNDRDHIRQVHSERRSRYTKAIEQLADEKATICLGGIYTLVGLVDEWLTDNSLEPDEQQKEGQIIINTLCAYIRSPFHLAEKRDILEPDIPPNDYEGNFAEDRAEFLEEANIRKSIFDEINKRITIKIDENNINIREIVGTWSNFTFDFFAAPIFYFIQYYTYTNTSFHAAKFYGQTTFSNSHFFGKTDFTDAIFYGPVEFNDTLFFDGVSFSWAKFKGNASFQPAIFKNDALFIGAEFAETANFTSSVFEGRARFEDAEFSQKPIFIKHTHIPDAYPNNCLYVPALFSHKVASKEHNFLVSPTSTFDISLGSTSFKNNDYEDDYEIPMGTRIFAPDSWSKEENNYLDMSSPAQ
ncbi:pentapeptide repeat-containing protein [Rothia mucilaginosa]|nr:pentapeptide repeat-containing protein [uncultured Rothia sp.]